MTPRLTEVRLWQRNLACLIRSGLFQCAEIRDDQGLFTIVGVYPDGACSAPLAKYADRRRAEDALGLIAGLVTGRRPADDHCRALR